MNLKDENISTSASGEDIGLTVDHRAATVPPEMSSPIEKPAPTLHDDSTAVEKQAEDNPQRSNALSDAKRYRKRAQAAEREVEQLKKNLAEREKLLQAQNQAIATLQRQEQIETLLHEAGALDHETVRALIESAAAEQPEIQLAEVVNELKRQKPHLFRQITHRSRGVMAAVADEQSAKSIARDHAAQESRQSGKRSDLLRYLRLRRSQR